MRPNTLTMSDQDMQNLAAYFASQKPKNAAGKK
jgi:cytochrome c553